jgi:Protein of unknown function (DUF1579)
MRKLMFVAPLLLIVGTAVLVAGADKADANKNPFQQYIEKYGSPGPEHKQLEPLVGSWTAQVSCWMDPNQPAAKSEGTAERKWIMDGRYVEEHFTGKLMDKPFHGLGIVGFDRAKSKFTCLWLDSVVTTMEMSAGTYDESTKTFTFKHEGECPITHKHVRTRNTLRLVSADEQRMDMYRQLGDEKEMKMMEITFTRKK